MRRQMPVSAGFLVVLLSVAVAWGTAEVCRHLFRAGHSDPENSILLLLRTPGSPEQLAGPRWLQEAMRDFTSLGGYAVLITTTGAFAVFAILELGLRECVFFLLTVCGGFVTSLILKEIIHRPRPNVVPHLSHVSGNTSFPSAHSLMSIVVYLTMGLMLCGLTRNRALRHLLTGLPLAIAGLVGVSRVCMGVHFPTDVLGGWTGGLTWTLAAFWLRGRFRSEESTGTGTRPLVSDR